MRTVMMLILRLVPGFFPSNNPALAPHDEHTHHIVLLALTGAIATQIKLIADMFALLS